jgi:predicted nucleic acid-binding protein
VAQLLGGVGGVLVLDAEGLTKLASGDSRARSLFEDARAAEAAIVIAASTLTEVLRGGQRDAAIHRVLRRIEIASIDGATAREAGELLGRVGLSGHSHALDALVAVVALAQPRPVVLLTSDTEDLARLTEEPQRPSTERVVVVRV